MKIYLKCTNGQFVDAASDHHQAGQHLKRPEDVLDFNVKSHTSGVNVGDDSYGKIRFI